jgi:hypothetical protein
MTHPEDTTKAGPLALSLHAGLCLLYAERDHAAQGDHYTRHVSAMTREGLHAKSAIAAELAHRDMEIERLKTDARMLRDMLRNAQTAICRMEREGWTGGTSCDQAAEALHATRYLRP